MISRGPKHCLPRAYQEAFPHGLRYGWKLAFAETSPSEGAVPGPVYRPLIWVNRELAGNMRPYGIHAGMVLGQWTWSDLDSTGPLTVFADLFNALGYIARSGGWVEQEEPPLALLRVSYLPADIIRPVNPLDPCALWYGDQSLPATLLPPGTALAVAVYPMQTVFPERIRAVLDLLADIYATAPGVGD